MKKKYLLLILLLISMFTFIKVNAKGPFYFDWETDETDSKQAYNHIDYKDGYIMLDSGSSGTIISLYDKNGNQQREKTIKDEYYHQNPSMLDYQSIIVIEDNIYILLTSYNYETDKEIGNIYLLNDKLEIVKKVTNNYYSMRQLEGKIVANIVNKDKNETIVYDTNLDELTEDIPKYEYNVGNAQNYLEEKYAEDIDNPFAYPSSDFTSDNYIYGINRYNKELCPFSSDGDMDMAGQTYDSTRTNNFNNTNITASLLSSPVLPMNLKECIIPTVVLLDKDTKEVWVKELKDYYLVTEVRFLGEYIGVIVARESSSDILIFDMKGNQLQKFNSPLGFRVLQPTKRGFIVDQGYCVEYPDMESILGDDNNNNPIPENSPLSNIILSSLLSNNQNIIQTSYYYPSFNIGCEGGNSMEYGKKSVSYSYSLNNHQVYYIFRNIEKKVTGKGEVNVTNEEIPGEPVKFTIIPDEGYVLAKVIVTDKNGNKVEFTENTFTMPTSDVTLEVEFLAEEKKEEVKEEEIKDVIVEEKENPNTSDIAIVGVSLLALISLGVFFNQRKKLKSLQ